MNKLFQQLLQQAGSRIVPTANRAVQGFAYDLASPVLRGIATKANPGASNPQIVRSLGTVQDALVRPTSKFSQDIFLNPLAGSPRTSIPWGVASQLVRDTVGRRTPSVMLSTNARYIFDPAQRFLQEFGKVVAPSAVRTAASLRPSPASAAFPFDDALTHLGGQARYLQRQAQTGLETSVGQVGGIYRNLQGIGPTALNPLATRTPTTRLGKLGSFFNPLNPVNAAGTGISILTNQLPISENNKAALQIGASTPGPVPVKLLGGILGHDLNTGLNPNEQQYLAASRTGQRPFGGDRSIVNAEGKLWAGRNYGFQSPESFNALYDRQRMRQVGQIATLNNNEVMWDGKKWVRTNIEDIAQAPFGQLPASPQNIPVEEWKPTGQGTEVADAALDSTETGDPSYLKDAFKKALITRLLFQGSPQQSSSPASDLAFSSLLESQRELGRSIMG